MELQFSKTNAQAAETDLALARAALYSALALGFRRPTEDTLRRLVDEESVDALTDAAAVLDPLPFGAREINQNDLAATANSGLAAAVKSLARSQSLSVARLASSFDRLFGHTARGAVTPYETEYGTETLFQQPHEMGDLMGFYGAFGLTLNPSEHERPDHISCECEFLSFLALKEAYALEQGDAALVEATRSATRLFLRDHLGRFAPAFSARLKRRADGGFYGALANLCGELVAADCARFGVPLGSQSLGLRPAPDDRVPMACGSGAACPAMPGTSAAEE
ncbi:MAG TPA: molecular chaperone TorD family protein [Candidatus Acidoferrales bacterium]|nr:molecular chaperone TorD family protein [Candidatus Acidoferrales bacterium]